MASNVYVCVCVHLTMWCGPAPACDDLLDRWKGLVLPRGHMGNMAVRQSTLLFGPAGDREARQNS